MLMSGWREFAASVTPNGIEPMKVYARWVSELLAHMSIDIISVSKETEGLS